MPERRPRRLLFVGTAHGMMFFGALGTLVASSPLMGPTDWPFLLFASAVLAWVPLSWQLFRRATTAINAPSPHRTPRRR